MTGVQTCALPIYILKNYLKVSKPINIDSTSGVYDFVLPNKKLFETINWLSTYAQPKGYVGADMLFYENSTGYYLRSLQKLFSQKPKYNYYYQPKNINENIAMNRTDVKLYVMAVPSGICKIQYNNV